MGKMGFKRFKDGKDGFQTMKKMIQFNKNYNMIREKYLEKKSRKAKIFIFRNFKKNIDSRMKMFGQNPSFPSFGPIFPIFRTHLSHLFENPSFPSFKTKDGFWKDGSTEKNPSFPSFQHPSFPSYPSLKDGLPTPDGRHGRKSRQRHRPCKVGQGDRAICRQPYL